MTYLILALLWSCVVATALHTLGAQEFGMAELFRHALWAIWGPDNLFNMRNESSAFYAFAVVNAAVSVLLPLFTLGAFVFKLFQHDPLNWRERLCIEADQSGQFVLVVRFYNRFSVPASDINVRAWLRWRPSDNMTVLRNKPLDLLVRGDHCETASWPLAMPAEPTTVKVVLAPTLLDRPPMTDGDIVVQDEVVDRRSANIVLIVEGTAGSLNERFRSIKTYKLTDIDTEHFQGINPDKPNAAEWKNFEGTQLSYVFVYGSLMREKDLQDFGLGGCERLQATLDGWHRRWNVASDPARKGRVYRDADTDVIFTGRMCSLGLEQNEDHAVRGIVVEVDYLALAAFDLREQEYHRTDVTSSVTWGNMRPSRPFRVFTYVPTPKAVREFERRRNDDDFAIAQSYYLSVKSAAAQVDNSGDDFDEITALGDLKVVNLVRDSG